MAPSTQPAETEPANSPSSRTAIWLPVWRGAEPEVFTTVASATPWPAASHLRAISSTSISLAEKTWIFPGVILAGMGRILRIFGDRLHCQPLQLCPFIGMNCGFQAFGITRFFWPPFSPILKRHVRTYRSWSIPSAAPIDYVRVSVTDRCNLRCTYCMSEHMTFMPKAELLTLEELDRVCIGLCRPGREHLRLTGGEPLVRRDFMDLVSGLSRHLASGALEELTLTTNGVRLAEFADGLAAAGVRRINVSLDSLDRATFARIARGDHLDQVLDGIAAAKQAGLKIKINTVALKNGNEAEFPI